MRIIKVLNNNAVIVKDEGQEKIAIGPGVGFQKKKNDRVPIEKIEKLFILKENEKFQRLLLRIPEDHLMMAEEILAYAEKHLQTPLDDHALLSLADHLSFAIEREQKGIHVRNKLLQEIKILYKKEFEVGLWAIKQIQKKLQIKMPMDEAAFIALHIHMMKIQGGDLQKTVRQTAIVKEMVNTITDYLNITLKEDEISYERLVNHLRYALSRNEHPQSHALDHEILSMIQRKFALSYQCALAVARKLSTTYHIHLSEEELGYITLHIERLRND